MKNKLRFILPFALLVTATAFATPPVYTNGDTVSTSHPSMGNMTMCQYGTTAIKAAQCDGSGNLTLAATGLTLSTPAATRVCVTPTVTTSGAYTSNFDVGGVMTFANVFRTGVNSGLLQRVDVFDAAGNSNTAYYVLIFSGALTHSTIADFSALTVNPADFPLLIGSASSISNTGTGAANNGTNVQTFLGGQQMVGTSTSVYVTLQAHTAPPTFTGASNLTVCITVQPN